MKRFKKLPILVVALALASTTLLWAASGTTGSKTTSPKAMPATSSEAPASSSQVAWGKVVSFTDTELVIVRHHHGKEIQKTFVVDPSTQWEGKPAEGAQVKVHYRVDNGQNIATQVMVHTPTKTASAKPKS